MRLVARPETPPSPRAMIPFRRDKDFVQHGTVLDDVARMCEDEAARVALVGISGVG